MASSEIYFRPALFRFFRELRENNDRDWFTANKGRYEESVLHPAQRFITDAGPRLRRISPHLNADPRPSGGSLFRIYRDVRFSPDKSPYKTHAGIHFRHKRGRDAHAPGYYFHLAPGDVIVGAGIWRPDGAAVSRIRDAIVAGAAGWKRLHAAKRFRETFEAGGESLKRPPRGYDPEHPLVEDLKRKDFYVYARLTEKDVTAPGFLDRFTAICRLGAPYVRFLCKALEVEF